LKHRAGQSRGFVAGIGPPPGSAASGPALSALAYLGRSGSSFRGQSRRHNSVAALALLLVALIVLLAAASSARAAVPVKGTYLGFNGRLAEINTAEPNSGFLELTAAVRVSRSRQRLSGRGDGSYVRFGFPCKLDRENWVSGTIPLAGRRMRPHIRRDGRFVAVKRRGNLRYRLRGRFVTPGAATLVYRASIRAQLPRNPRRSGRCTSPLTRVALFLDGEPPFGGCRTQPATTLLSSPTGRLFAQYRLTSQGFMPYVFGCLFDTDRRFPLGQAYDDAQVALPRLAGPFAAWVAACSAAGPCTGSIGVLDLRTGAFVHRGIFPDTPLDPYSSGFADLELKDNASVAWIAVHSGMGGPPPVHLGTEVWALDGLGRRMLDSGADISPGSLRLQDSTLTWENGGVERSAPLH
jgi:opacity protein-like surface antigen